MSEKPKDEFKDTAPGLFKALRAKITFLKKSEGPVDELLTLLDEAENKLESDPQLASDKYEEANGKFVRLIRPFANSILRIEFFYLAVWLIVAYGTFKFPEWWLWNGIISQGTIAAWYGALGGITIGIFGIYNHVKVGDFDPRFRLWYICKPFIGGIFGWFSYGLYVIGFVTVQKSDITDIKNPMFVYIVAFLAGFSERFILRLIDKLMAVITSYDEKQTEKKDVQGS
jgi:hypothetical protein